MRHNVKGPQTTLGDLVLAVTDAAMEISSNEKRAYQIASAVVNRVLRLSVRESRRLSEKTHRH